MSPTFRNKSNNHTTLALRSNVYLSTEFHCIAKSIWEYQKQARDREKDHVWLLDRLVNRSQAVSSGGGVGGTLQLGRGIHTTGERGEKQFQPHYCWWSSPKSALSTNTIWGQTLWQSGYARTLQSLFCISHCHQPLSFKAAAESDRPKRPNFYKVFGPLWTISVSIITPSPLHPQGR